MRLGTSEPSAGRSGTTVAHREQYLDSLHWRTDKPSKHRNYRMGHGGHFSSSVRMTSKHLSDLVRGVIKPKYQCTRPNTNTSAPAVLSDVFGSMSFFASNPYDNTLTHIHILDFRSGVGYIPTPRYFSSVYSGRSSFLFLRTYLHRTQCCTTFEMRLRDTGSV